MGGIIREGRGRGMEREVGSEGDGWEAEEIEGGNFLFLLHPLAVQP